LLLLLLKITAFFQTIIFKSFYVDNVFITVAGVDVIVVVIDVAVAVVFEDVVVFLTLFL